MNQEHLFFKSEDWDGRKYWE